MKRKKVFLLIQSVLCILLTVLLAAAVIGICRKGTALKAEDPLAWIYSKEMIAEYFRPIIPLLFVTIGVTVVGLILGIKDENGLKPAKGGKVQNPGPSVRAGTVRTVLLITAVCLLIAGAVNGSAKDVFTKAVNICTECIGLG